jgi:hypothetical protein
MKRTLLIALLGFFSLASQAQDTRHRCTTTEETNALYDSYPQYRQNQADLELMAPIGMDIVCFRFNPGGLDDAALNALNKEILMRIHEQGIAVPSYTTLNGQYCLRIAIANPDHAPYGLAAKQALESAGIWERVRPKLVYGDNIRQTLQYAETGNVDVSIVALSVSIQSRGRWTLIPEELHQPIDQGLGIIKTTKNEKAARAFAAFLAGPQGQAIMKKYGFSRE